MAEEKNKSTNKSNDEKNAFPPAKGKVNPDAVVNNPDMQYSGRSTDNRNIRDTGHSPGSPESQSRDGVHGNYGNPDSYKDQNKSGHVTNTGEREQTASDMDTDGARPNSKYEGVSGKTMVKNSELSDYHSQSRTEGQQQGGNHGGGNAANKKYGNQADLNSQKEKKQSSDGDYKGQK